MADEARDRRAGFDSVARTYHRARPDYPAHLLDQLAALTGLGPGSRVLEVGCGTGKATLALARLGCVVTAIDIGAHLVQEARRNLGGFDGVEIIQADLETWAPPADASVDVVVAATSWHWVDPAVRYRRAWEALRPGGHLAFWSALHVFPDGGDPFFTDLQPVYDEIGMPQPPGEGTPRPGELPEFRDEIEASGLFGDVRIRHIDWTVDYTAEQYLDLIGTFSGHIAMTDAQRNRLYGEVRRRIAQRPDRRVRRGWGAALHVATRVDGALG